MHQDVIALQTLYTMSESAVAFMAAMWGVGSSVFPQLVLMHSFGLVLGPRHILYLDCVCISKMYPSVEIIVAPFVHPSTYSPLQSLHVIKVHVWPQSVCGDIYFTYVRHGSAYVYRALLAIAV